MTHSTYYKRCSTPYACRTNPPTEPVAGRQSCEGAQSFSVSYENSEIQKGKHSATAITEPQQCSAFCFSPVPFSSHHHFGFVGILLTHAHDWPACFSTYWVFSCVCGGPPVSVSAANIIREAQRSEWIWSSRLFPVDVCLQLLPHLQ